MIKIYFYCKTYKIVIRPMSYISIFHYRHKTYQNVVNYCMYFRYQYGHIWSCPPKEGVDYIFNEKPPHQAALPQKVLNEWYKRLLELGIVSYLNLLIFLF